MDKKIQKSWYSEKMTDKRKTYVCYICNKWSVRYKKGHWECCLCGAEHATVESIKQR